ncbi:nuclear transport factor 2 family protein [Cryptosporangium arvum]|uniref:SnoaL-like polyketide cyclase,polyketide cyclase/dehydrase and lipid transport protein n=1 Tax=Cryptosporangium arvum DSM 44712 TaxID=927661 RepID=A0A010ZNV0_9ACTN|nr:nuclear transport factor 2 family protein [Cryptosporangium arvum]EXG80359.1 SnoaL-like polyketide cyclase,polyketide cyclase/dehydrase and lipid transport protein [Cryptosporangium arvum DSM 44712]
MEITKYLAAAATGVAIVAALPTAASAHRSYERCGGTTVDRSAPVIARASVFVRASEDLTWRMHTAIDEWETWIPEIVPARQSTPGPLRPGSVFDWSPQNMTVTSTVTKVEPRRCTAWAAPVNGIDGVHLFTFEKVRGGVVVTTEESWAGKPVQADVPGFQKLLQTGLDDWVGRFKEVAERGGPARNEVRRTPRIVGDWLRYWNAGDGKRLGSLFTPDGRYTDHSAGVTFTGPAGVAQWVATTVGGVDDVHGDLRQVHRYGDRIVLGWTFSGHVKGAPSAFRLPAVTVLQLRGNRVVSNDDYYSHADLLARSGLPADWKPPAN